MVSALTMEVRTASTQAWLGARDADDLLVSDWVTTELSAALSIKLRNRQIDENTRVQALSGYRQLLQSSLIAVPVAAEQFHAAAQFADQFALGLRAGDALHLAVAFEQGATLCTLDRRLAGAGPRLGVQTLLV